ncbi:MAG: hypothetical protein A2428_15520 [Bdellovibrionales bacterium RIFOXYC1_FULL_54_43]|nr:MAG: hypothetical protein A2428_15520 [Bdellovibrionales bacterium RIFOXYC1_FULL_54_43]OFZ84776.1 MAG: hypothetical protein A2603_05340 [Bdellovibrionales bacterium RIFOXYD1_FULL_55_31]
MRHRFPLLITLSGILLGHTSLAGYKEDLARLKHREKSIDAELARFGIQNSRQPDPATIQGTIGAAPEAKPAPPLYQVHDSFTRLRTPAGKLLFGKTLTRLVVGGEVSPAIVLLHNGQGLFSGLRVLGKARQSGTPGRLQIDFDRVIFRSGKVAMIKAGALDQAGAYGLEAQVFTGKALAVAGAMAASFVSGLAASQQSTSPTSFGFSQVQPTGRNAVLQGIAQTAADQSKRLIEESTQEKPVMVVEADTPVSVYVDEEVRF